MPTHPAMSGSCLPPNGSLSVIHSLVIEDAHIDTLKMKMEVEEENVSECGNEAPAAGGKQSLVRAPAAVGGMGSAPGVMARATAHPS